MSGGIGVTKKGPNNMYVSNITVIMTSVIINAAIGHDVMLENMVYYTIM